MLFTLLEQLGHDLSSVETHYIEEKQELLFKTVLPLEHKYSRPKERRRAIAVGLKRNNLKPFAFTLEDRYDN